MTLHAIIVSSLTLTPRSLSSSDDFLHIAPRQFRTMAPNTQGFPGNSLDNFWSFVVIDFLFIRSFHIAAIRFYSHIHYIRCLSDQRNQVRFACALLRRDVRLSYYRTPSHLDALNDNVQTTVMSTTT